MRLPVSSYRRRAEWTRPYPCDTVLDERYVRTSVVCLRSKLYRKHTAPRATLAHTSISLHFPLHSAVRPRRTAHPSQRPLSRSPTSPHPQIATRRHTSHTTPTHDKHEHTQSHTPLSSLGATSSLHTSATPLLRSLRQPCCIWSPPFTPLVHGPQLLCSLEREPTPSTRTHTV